MKIIISENHKKMSKMADVSNVRMKTKTSKERCLNMWNIDFISKVLNDERENNNERPNHWMKEDYNKNHNKHY